MKSLIIILGLMSNGDQVVVSQTFAAPCPSMAELQQAANELRDMEWAKRVVVTCHPADDKPHSVTVKGTEGTPA